jgi:transcriptional regulator with AAA-type ATPase domain
MRAVLEKVRTVAPTRATVLLTGETGVGKGVLARLIHHWSNRKNRAFVAVHCGAIPDTLLESELFGHEKGSFTGADRRKRGKFELAHEGTLFLDEVGTIPPLAQVKLLDVLQERRLHRVGGEEDVEVDVRIVAATNSDLNRAQREGEFRADLFHRLNVFPLEIPPLRERGEDLPALAAHLLERLNGIYSKEITGLDPAVEEAFHRYAWPGNVRELENVLERAVILESSSRISPRHIPLDVLETLEKHAAVPVPIGSGRSLAEVRNEAVVATERRYLEELLATHHGRIDASAETAGITTRQLRKLLGKHGIRKESFKAPGSAREQALRSDATRSAQRIEADHTARRFRIASRQITRPATGVAADLVPVKSSAAAALVRFRCSGLGGGCLAGSRFLLGGTHLLRLSVRLGRHRLILGGSLFRARFPASDELVAAVPVVRCKRNARSSSPVRSFERTSQFRSLFTTSRRSSDFSTSRGSISATVRDVVGSAPPSA